MAKKLPLAYFPGYIAAIYKRKVDKWAQYRAKTGTPYFETWIEAHGYMLNRARTAVARLEKDLASAKRHLAKVEKMEEPKP